MINPQQFLPNLPLVPAVIIIGIALLFALWYFYRQSSAYAKKSPRALALGYRAYTLEWPDLASEHNLAALCQFLLHWTGQFESDFKLALEVWQNEDQKIYALIIPHKAQLLVAGLAQHFPDLVLRQIYNFKPVFLTGQSALWNIKLEKKSGPNEPKKIKSFFHYDQNGKYSPTRLTWQWLFLGEQENGASLSGVNETQACGQVRLALSHPDSIAGEDRLIEINNSLRQFLRQTGWKTEIEQISGTSAWDNFLTRKTSPAPTSTLDIPDLVKLLWEI